MSHLKFYLLKNDEAVGPYTSEEFVRLYHDRILSPDTPVTPEGATEWQTAQHWISQISAAAPEPENHQSTEKEDSKFAEAKPTEMSRGCAGCAVVIACMLFMFSLIALSSAFFGYSNKSISGFEFKQRSDYVRDKGMPFFKREPVWTNESASVNERIMIGLGGLILGGLGAFLYVFTYKELRKSDQRAQDLERNKAQND